MIQPVSNKTFLSTKSSKIDSQGLDEIWNNTFSENRQSLSKLNFKLDGDPMIPSARINTLEESLKIYNPIVYM